MKDKYLPIQMFHKRRIDDRSTEGGGDNKKPKWILEGDALIERSQSIVSQLSNLNISYNEYRKNTELPFIIETEINNESKAKSYRKTIRSVFDDRYNKIIIGFKDDNKLLSSINSNCINNIIPYFENINDNYLLISSILNINKFKPYIKKSEQNDKIYKVRLIDFNSDEINKKNIELFKNYCKQKEINIKSATYYTDSIIVYKLFFNTMKDFDSICNFEGLYSLEPMPKITINLDSLIKGENINFNIPKKDTLYPVVGILDTGISEKTPLKSWLISKKHSNYPKEYQNNSHGTFVAGLLEYGDDLNGSNDYYLEGVNIFDAIVFPDENKEEIHQDDLIEHIKEAIKRNKEIKIWNLSIGTNEESNMNRFSEFAMALDYIQDKYDVIIVKSAGNCNNFTKNQEVSRISNSADSVRAIVVGSISNIDNNHSPFSRIGPGPCYITKPDLVHYGGHVDKNKNCNGVKSFDINGNIVTNCGTSFSTPRVSRLCSELQYLINYENNFDAVLLKALLIHSGNYTNINMSMEEKIKKMGFGKPSSTKEILYNSDYEITLVLRDNLKKGEFIEITDFPFPKSLLDDEGMYRGHIYLTLVSKVLLDDKQGGEYCQSNIDVLFGTYNDIKQRDTSKNNIKNPIGFDDTSNVLDYNLYSKKILKDYENNKFNSEKILIKCHGKYHPIKKWVIDLSDMTLKNKEKILSSNRKWGLRIKGLYRDHIETTSAYNGIQLSQEYCLIITIKDPDETVQVYNETIQAMDIGAFIHQNINIRDNINIILNNRI